jgi:nitrogen fixation/metabolism regulation signal transduction histidine kinase
MFLRPVNALLGVTHRLVQGDLRARWIAFSPRELDELAHEFDRMVEALEQRDLERGRLKRKSANGALASGFMNAISNSLLSRWILMALSILRCRRAVA